MDQKKDGHWRPADPVMYSPLFERPFNIVKTIKWIFGWGGFLWPLNLFYVCLAWVSYNYLQPRMGAFESFEIINVVILLSRNIGLAVLIYGFYHLMLYSFKLYGTRGKYNQKWLEKGKKKFKFGNQVYDNIFYSLCSGVPIWTAYEFLYFSLGANGNIPIISYQENTVWFFLFFLFIPFFRETHFYFIHRLIHWKPLLRMVHSVHHRNPNPGPWSGLSMHPVEHLLYFSPIIVTFLVPSHPLHMLFIAQLAGLTPAKGHTGFDGPFLGGALPSGDYFHYLHHKHVTCNFGTGLIPWDRWLGRFFDGAGDYKRK